MYVAVLIIVQINYTVDSAGAAAAGEGGPQKSVALHRAQQLHSSVTLDMID